jgi:hypothetical protein
VTSTTTCAGLLTRYRVVGCRRPFHNCALFTHGTAGVLRCPAWR